MIPSLAVLLSCQLAGEIVARVLALPVPGPVLGIVLLVLVMQALARGNALDAATLDGTDLGRTAGSLLQSLGLLFVPAGVGVIEHLDLFVRHGIGLLVALIGSTLVTLVVTVLVFAAVRGRLARRNGGTPS
jgi:holin-like protein